ncbi:MAG TPA: hypothetical protein V6C65_36405 [Allocoleopsis sp.]
MATKESGSKIVLVIPGKVKALPCKLFGRSIGVNAVGALDGSHDLRSRAWYRLQTVAMGCPMSDIRLTPAFEMQE